MYNGASAPLPDYNLGSKSIQPESEPPVLPRLLNWLEKLNKENDDLVAQLSMMCSRLNSEPEKTSIPDPSARVQIVSGSGALQGFEMMLSQYANMVDNQRSLLKKLDRLI